MQDCAEACEQSLTSLQEGTDGGLSGLRISKNRSPKPPLRPSPTDPKASRRDTAQQQTPALSNHTTAPLSVAPAPLRTADMVREEAQLILDDNDDDESTEKSSSNSSIVSAQVCLQRCRSSRQG